MLVDCNGVHIKKNIHVSFLKLIKYVILAWFECVCRLQHICLQVAGCRISGTPRGGGLNRAVKIQLKLKSNSPTALPLCECGTACRTCRRD